MNTLKNTWSQLLSSKTGDEEIKLVNEIRRLIKSKDGYFSIYVTITDGRKVDAQSVNDADTPFQNVEIDFHWEDQRFVGKGWTPRNKDNVFAFYLE